MREIIVNPKLLDTPTDQLLKQLAQVHAFKDEPCLRFLSASLKCAQKCEVRARLNKTRAYLPLKKNPFNEILILLKDSYQGKLNDYLREMLCSTELDILANKNMPNEPENAWLLKLKIQLAAALIAKYDELISLVVSEKLTTNQQDIIKNAIKYLKPLNNQLNGVDLLYLISRFKLECHFQIIQNKATHCFSFFCFGNTSNKLRAVDLIINNLMRYDLTASEMTGGLLLLYIQIGKVFDYNEAGAELLSSLDNLLTNNNFLSINTATKPQLIQGYIQRAKQLELEWPQPFDIFNTNHFKAINELPKWSPGVY